MSITMTPPTEDAYADRWRHWQRKNDKSSRKSARQARIVLAVVMTAAIAWLGLQLLSS